MPKPIPLLNQLRIAIRSRHYSCSTEKVYVYWVKSYILFHDKQYPKTLNQCHIESYLSHLVINKQVSPSTQKKL